jgi:hypothetical protein
MKRIAVAGCAYTAADSLEGKTKSVKDMEWTAYSRLHSRKGRTKKKEKY